MAIEGVGMLKSSASKILWKIPEYLLSKLFSLVVHLYLEFIAIAISSH